MKHVDTLLSCSKPRLFRTELENPQHYPIRTAATKNTTTYDWPISTRVRCPCELLADCEFALREVNHLGLNICAWLCNSFRNLSELTWGWTDWDPSRNNHCLLSNCFGCNIIYAGILCTWLYLGLHTVNIDLHLVYMHVIGRQRAKQSAFPKMLTSYKASEREFHHSDWLVTVRLKMLKTKSRWTDSEQLIK